MVQTFKALHASHLPHLTDLLQIISPCTHPLLISLLLLDTNPIIWLSCFLLLSPMDLELLASLHL